MPPKGVLHSKSIAFFVAAKCAVEKKKMCRYGKVETYPSG